MTGEADLDGLRRECGCRAGAVALVLSVVAEVAACQLGFWSVGTSALLGRCAAVSLSAAVLAKLVAIAWARARYRRLRVHLLR